jgi:hypothetical protein
MDGQNWTPLYTDTPTPDFSSPLRVQPISFVSPQPVTARYVRVNAERTQSAPASYSGGAKNTWLFVDEILVH